MLTYATILIASLIVAVVALFLYKVISDSSRSVYSSKNGIAITDRSPVGQKNKARHSAVTDALNSLDDRSLVTPGSMAKTIPAMPSSDSSGPVWQGGGNQASGQLAHHGAGGADASHCSLYDVSVAEPKLKRNRNTGWPYREEKAESSGRVYKVKRKSAAQTASPQTINKPWGW